MAETRDNSIPQTEAPGDPCEFVNTRGRSSIAKSARLIEIAVCAGTAAAIAGPTGRQAWPTVLETVLETCRRGGGPSSPARAAVGGGWDGCGGGEGGGGGFARTGRMGRVALSGRRDHRPCRMAAPAARDRGRRQT